MDTETVIKNFIISKKGEMTMLRMLLLGMSMLSAVLSAAEWNSQSSFTDWDQPSALKIIDNKKF